MEDEGMELDIIVNPKTTDDGQAVIQLETAAGDAIKHFNNAHGVNVPRSRFLPVKSCSDLLLIKSDIYSLEHGQLIINPQRMFETTPVIKLGDHFKKIAQFQKRFKKIPKILELDHLTVTGDVYFGRNVTLRGTVIVVANEGQRIDIPDGCVLENRLLSGNLNMIVRALFSSPATAVTNAIDPRRSCKLDIPIPSFSLADGRSPTIPPNVYPHRTRRALTPPSFLLPQPCRPLVNHDSDSRLPVPLSPLAFAYSPRIDVDGA